MKLYNTTTKETVELVITDPATDTNIAGQIIGDSWHDLETVEIDGVEELSGDADQCEWWIDYCDRLNDAEQKIYDFLEENEDLRDDYNNFIGGVEFNDRPDAIINFIKSNK